MKNRINRRKMVAGLGVMPVAAAVAHIPSAQAMTPLERIKHHLKELEAAFSDYYPDNELHSSFNEVTPEHLEHGCVGCAMVHTSSKRIYLTERL